jgi:hypothetical protein
MDVNAARTLALSLSEAEEHDHRGRPSFRVGKRIFATLWSEDRRAVLKLSPDDQAALIALKPDCFSPIPGGWGRQGWTSVDLGSITPEELEDALHTAWRHVAPKRLQ